MNELKDAENYSRDVNRDLINITETLKGRIRFGSGTSGERGENIAGEFVTYTSNAVADTEDTVAHTLGAAPVGFIIINRDKGGVVYDSGTAWTSSNLYLKCSTASTVVDLFLLK